MSGWRRGIWAKNQCDDCLNILGTHCTTPAGSTSCGIAATSPASCVRRCTTTPRPSSHRRTVAFLATLLRPPHSHAPPREKKFCMPILILEVTVLFKAHPLGVLSLLGQLGLPCRFGRPHSLNPEVQGESLLRCGANSPLKMPLALSVCGYV